MLTVKNKDTELTIPFSYDELSQMSATKDPKWIVYSEEQIRWIIGRLIETISIANGAIKFPVRRTDKVFKDAEMRKLLAHGILDTICRHRATWSSERKKRA